MITHNITIYPNGNTIDEIIVRQWDNLSHRMVFTLPPQVAQASGITAHLRVLPNGAKAPYVYPCEISGTEAACTPTYEAWAWQGIAHIQLVVYAGESVVWQSSRIPVTVQGSIDEAGATTPEEGKTLIQELHEALDEAAGIIEFEVEAKPLPEGSDPTAERIVDPATGRSTILFGMAPGPEGKPGAKGEPGKGLDILGTYDTLEDLRASVIRATQGDMYNVGTEAPYNIYMWEQSELDWIDQGKLEGPPGKQGDPGRQGDPGKNGEPGPAGPNEITEETKTPLNGILNGNGTNVTIITPQEGRDLLNVTPYTYGYYGKDLSQIFSPAELGDKIDAGDYEGINMGDYWPIVLNGTAHDYADDADITFSNALMEMEFMPNFYGRYGDTALPDHCLVCSRDYMPIALKMRSANDVWYDTVATNPMLGSHLHQTLNNPNNGIIKLVEQTELGPYIYAGPNGKGMRFLMETKAAGATTATGSGWNDRGKLFLPTEREVWGQDVFSEHGYGGAGNALQWPIFAGSIRHIIKGLGNGGSRYYGWCASSRSGAAPAFCVVDISGVSGSSGSTAVALGVPLCFLLVKKGE